MNKPPQGVEILSVEAKDIYLANNYIHKSDTGYCIRYQRGVNQGILNFKKFINTLDYSLDLIKWEKIRGRHISNREEPMYNYMGIHRYTQDFINITFNYSVKLYNKKNGSIYVKSGYDIDIRDLEEGVFVKNGDLIAIDTDFETDEPLEDEVLGKYFYYDTNIKKYRAKNNIPTLLSNYDLRAWIYNNPFLCDGRTYVRWKRSTGSSRVGKCLFIDERLYQAMHNYEMMGLKIRNNDDVDLASLEAYISLTLSSIVDTLEIEPKNILVIDDYESVFNELCIDTTNIDGKLVTEKKEKEISNSIWDGQSLIDVSLMGDYSCYGMILLRNRFFKSCCFNTNIQQWFKDNNITSVEQLNGFTLAENIEDVKLITTPNSVKFVKFGTIQEWLERIENTFGVVKHEKKTHHLNGNCVSTHYQLLNTLQLNKNEVKELLEEQFDYLKLIRDEPCVLRNHISYGLYHDDYSGGFDSNNDITYRLLGLNNDFAKTRIYEKFKKDVYDSYIKNLRKLHLLIHGNYSTLCGNPIEMLQQAIGSFDGTSYIQKHTVSTNRFEYNTDILGSRSPHVSPSCVLVTKNVGYELLDKYMNRTPEIIYVNSIDEALLDKLSGADFDSDTMLITNNKILIKAAKRNYEKFLPSTNSVKAKKIKRKYNNDEKADLDYKNSENNIGEIINLAQIIMSEFWDNLNNGVKYEDIEYMISDIDQLNIMSGIEIDSSKKEFDISNAKELAILRDKYIKKNVDGYKIKPYFFYYILKYKELLDEKTEFIKFKTTADYIEEYIDSVFRKKDYRCGKRKTYLNFFEVIDQTDYVYDAVNRKQIKILKDLLEKYDKDLKTIYASVELTNYEKVKIMDSIKYDYFNTIQKMKINNNTIIYLLKILDNKTMAYLYKKCFNLLFCEQTSKFYKVIKDASKDVEILKRNNDGNLTILGYKYSKIDLKKNKFVEKHP